MIYCRCMQYVVYATRLCLALTRASLLVYMIYCGCMQHIICTTHAPCYLCGIYTIWGMQFHIHHRSNLQILYTPQEHFVLLKWDIYDMVHVLFHIYYTGNLLCSCRTYEICLHVLFQMHHKSNLFCSCRIYVCIHTYIHTYIQTNVHTYIHTYYASYTP